MSKLVTILGLVFLLGLSASACATVPTPSGSPELKVRLSPEEIQSQVVNHFAPDWTLQGSDPLGFSIVTGLSASTAVEFGSGAKRIRFNLVKAGEGVTQIRVFASIVTAGVETDESKGKWGFEIQEMLQEIFASEAVDGPYTKTRPMY